LLSLLLLLLSLLLLLLLLPLLLLLFLVVVVVVVVFLKLLMTSLSHCVLQAWRTHLTKQCSTNTKRLQQLKQQGRYAHL
jgi:hypothetical protein